MTLTNLYVNDNVDSDLENMLNDISSLEEILNNVVTEIDKLDENVWKTKEKDQIDQTFIPFLKKYKDRYPNFLRKNVDIVKNKGIEQYRNLESKISDSISQV